MRGVSCIITSHRITSHHITPHLITSPHHITSHLTSHLTSPHHIASHLPHPTSITRTQLAKTYTLKTRTRYPPSLSWSSMGTAQAVLSPPPSLSLARSASASALTSQFSSVPPLAKRSLRTTSCCEQSKIVQSTVSLATTQE